MNNLADYAYLWEQPNDGWVLLRINRQAVALTVRFPAEGPSLRHVAAMRSAIPEFRAMNPSQAFAALRGKVEIPLGEFDSRESRLLSQKCKEHGLLLEAVTLDKSGYLPFNEKTNMALIIEDGAIANMVCQEAIVQGIQVRQLEA